MVMSGGEHKEEKVNLEHGQLPDPEAKAISCLFDQIRALERKVRELTEEQERLRAVQPGAVTKESA
jgi:serine O-acetyltransferase